MAAYGAIRRIPRFSRAVRAGRPAGAAPRDALRIATLFYALAVNSDVVTAWTQLALRSEDASDTLKTLDLVGQPPARNLYLLFRDSAVAHVVGRVLRPLHR